MCVRPSRHLFRRLSVQPSVRASVATSHLRSLHRETVPVCRRHQLSYCRFIDAVRRRGRPPRSTSQPGRFPWRLGSTWSSWAEAPGRCRPPSRRRKKGPSFPCCSPALPGRRHDSHLEALARGESYQSPLSKAIFTGDQSAAASEIPHPNRLRYSYSADTPCDPSHQDHDPPSKLSDGLWHDPIQDSVQFNGDVNLIFDLGQPQEIAALRLMCYTRTGEYRVHAADVFTSDDGRNWAKRCSITPESKQIATHLAGAEADLNVAARYVRLFVQKYPLAKRILLGESKSSGRARERTEQAAALRPCRGRCMSNPCSTVRCWPPVSISCTALM